MSQLMATGRLRHCAVYQLLCRHQVSFLDGKELPGTGRRSPRSLEWQVTLGILVELKILVCISRKAMLAAVFACGNWKH